MPYFCYKRWSKWKHFVWGCWKIILNKVIGVRVLSFRFSYHFRVFFCFWQWSNASNKCHAGSLCIMWQIFQSVGWQIVVTQETATFTHCSETLEASRTSFPVLCLLPALALQANLPLCDLCLFINRYLTVLISFLSTWYKLATPGKRESQLRNCLHQISLCIILMIPSWCRKPAVGAAISGQVDLDCVRWLSKPGEQACKKCSSVVSASFPVSRFLPCLSFYFGFCQWWTVMEV